MIDVDWNKLATTTIKVELARSGIGYEELIRRLEEIGVHESYTGLAAKINRGTFSFAFFMQCMKALNKTKVTLD
jgi:DNA (cytosine-5)-methyltransferase 1